MYESYIHPITEHYRYTAYNISMLSNIISDPIAKPAYKFNTD